MIPKGKPAKISCNTWLSDKAIGYSIQGDVMISLAMGIPSMYLARYSLIAMGARILPAIQAMGFMLPTIRTPIIPDSPRGDIY